MAKKRVDISTEGNDALFVSLTADLTDDEIKDILFDLYPVCNKLRQGFMLTISGYDEDKRDLWEIPEVVAFYKRLIDFGFLSVLEVTTGIDGLARFPKCPGFGAVEVWMAATGRMVRGSTTLPIEDMDEFYALLQKSNQRILEVIRQPRPVNVATRKNVHKMQAEDGQHRWTGTKVRPRSWKV